MGKEYLGKDYKKINKRKLNKKKVAGCILILMLVIGVPLGIKKYNRTFDAKLVDSQVTVEEKLLEKEMIINDLTNQINELKTTQQEMENKQKELEKTIEEVKTSKVKAKQKVATTRSGTTTRSSAIPNVAPIVNTNFTGDKWIWANVSAYCACVKCCGKTNGITASGTRATVGRTIAAPSNYAFGTKIELEGLGTYTVEDRGGAITGNKIDVYFNSHSAALAFGRKKVRMRVVQ